MKKKFIMSYSCGKDSTLALYRMIKEGHTPLALLVTVDKDKKNSWFHEVPLTLLEKVSKSLGVPLLLADSKGDDYEAVFTETLIKGKELGAESCVFGDIDIDSHREWCTKRCKEANLKEIFPLWQENRESLTYEFIESGFKTVIKKVRLDSLDENFLGKTLTKELVNNIKEKGADPCGENGEYHTFVYDGPIFNEKINYKLKENIILNGYGYLNIE
ncbi:diphthine--ammonia ligase [Clostridium fallax]|uniref:MJ0570-related uncharacterized domain-containing protein n=1 Tax=Clostridium fallax TaxID=1533 RepID=A0A1M4Y2S5_9CLOT|nr:diphthine--ammonia ligase [Clostridium fallax]SHE99989.1 MJ0570-related uncharacterized domain-containing protein [Clostridium fallax]SQB07790.1 ATP-binding protein [Clostridium fallax]